MSYCYSNDSSGMVYAKSKYINVYIVYECSWDGGVN